MSRLVRRTYPGLDPRQRKSWSPVRWTGTAPSRSRPGYRERRAAAVAGDGRPAAGPLGLPPALSQQIRITLHSTIPVAKGMASSTADIAATAVATAHHLGHLLDEPTLARLCVALEPTDSTLFRQLTLFDHNTAATQIACPPPPALDLLVLESPLTLRTTDYHQLPRSRACWQTPPGCSWRGRKYSRPATAATRSCWAKQRPSAPLPASSCCLSRGLTRCWTWWKAQGSMVSTWRTAAASSACYWTAVVMTSNFCNGGWQTATSPPTGRSSICWRWCPGRHPAVGLRPAPGATPPAAGRFSSALRIATRK